jgi:hypothetical protein
MPRQSGIILEATIAENQEESSWKKDDDFILARAVQFLRF